ncbi:ATP-dependent DNA ligase [Streptomyces xanthophaeus]
MTLRPPVEPMLAQAVEPVPALVRDLAFEQKFDGHRALLFTPAEAVGRVLLQSRRGSLVQDRFPDLVAAAGQLPGGLALDGELLAWDTEAGQLSFEGLQRRAAARSRTAPALAARLPACYVVFDVLQSEGGVELLALPYRERRRRLEVLFASRALTAPWTLCPMTTDVTVAREWLESWTDVSGVEGLVIKPLSSRYLPNYRGWSKIRRRDTTEAIIGAITGTLTRPQLLVLGRHDGTGRLRAVGRTVVLRPEQARQIAGHLTATGPGHPWTGVRFAAAWGSLGVLDAVLVRPDLVAEISADRAVDRGGVFRHPLRFQRLRMDAGWRTFLGSGRLRLWPPAEPGRCGSAARACGAGAGEGRRLAGDGPRPGSSAHVGEVVEDDHVRILVDLDLGEEAAEDDDADLRVVRHRGSGRPRLREGLHGEYDTAEDEFVVLADLLERGPDGLVVHRPLLTAFVHRTSPPGCVPG